MILYDGAKCSPGEVNHGSTCLECGANIEWTRQDCSINRLAFSGLCRTCELKYMLVPTKLVVKVIRGWEEPVEYHPIHLNEPEGEPELPPTQLKPPVKPPEQPLGTTLSTNGKYTTENGRPEVKCDGMGRSTFFGLKDGDEVDGWLEFEDTDDEGYAHTFRGKLFLVCDWDDEAYAIVKGSSANGRKQFLLQDGDEIQVHRRL